MTCTYGGLPCLDPAQELSNCRLLGYSTPWAGVANSFTCPQGQDYGRGRVLMFRGDLLSLNLNTFYPLVFSDGTRSVTLKSILFVRAYCATPGGRGDPTEAYWCELADKRILCRQPIDKAYNVRSTPGGAYFSATLNSGTPWTWAQMAADIWFTVNKLGSTFPGLPFTPNGTPEGWAFWGSDAFAALGQVLERLGCALDYNPITDVFSIVRLGVTDATATSALAAVDPACVWDADPIEGVKAGTPAVLRVFFPNERDAADSTGGSPFTSRDVSDPTVGGPLSGTDPNRVAIVYDDLPAIYTAGVLSNGTALTSRAAERAADYFRRVRQKRLYRGYTGGYAAAGLLPGPQVTATIWRDTGDGLFTEVVRLPGPLNGDPFAGLAGDTPGGGGPGSDGSPGEAGGPGASGSAGIPGGAILLPPGVLGDSLPGGLVSLPPWLFNLNYLYLLLYNNFSVSLGGGGGGGGVEVKNVDNTQDTPGCTVFRVNNDIATGLLKWVKDGAATGYISWMGLQLYKAGVGLKGPETVLEVIDGTAILTTIADDPADGRVQLTIANTRPGNVGGSFGGYDVHYVGSTPDRRYFGGVAVNTSAPSSNSFTINTLFAVPFKFDGGGTTFDRVGVKVNAATAGGKVRCGIYANTSSTNPYPAGLLADGTTDLDASTTGVKEHTISLNLTPGTLYWLVMVDNNAGVFLNSYAGSAQGMFHLLGADNSYNGVFPLGWSVALTYPTGAALPGTYPAGGGLLVSGGANLPIPQIGVRIV